MKRIYSCMLAVALMFGVNSAANAQLDALKKLVTGAASSSKSSSSSSSSSSDSQGLLGSLLSTLVGNATTVSAKSVVGTWIYDTPECRFESESLLSKAGGEVAASEVEGKLADIYQKVGIKKGAYSMIFNEDGSATLVIGGKKISGTYTVDSKTRKLNFKSKSKLFSMTATAYQVGSTLTLLYESDKLMTVVKYGGALLGKVNSTAATLTTVMDSYDGMQLGMNMKKQ